MLSRAKWSQTPSPEGPRIQGTAGLIHCAMFAILHAVRGPSHLSLSPQLRLRLHETSPWRFHPGLRSGSRREVSCLFTCTPHSGHTANFALVPALPWPHHSMAMVTDAATHAVTNTITNNPFVSSP